MSNDSEHNIQASFVDTVLWEYLHNPTFIRSLFFAVPNGAFLGGNRPAVMQKLKREGFLPGVSDMLYLQARGDWNFLALELKTEKRRKEKSKGLSEGQEEFLNAVGEAGGLPIVAYGLDEAIEAFRDYMNLLPRVRIIDVIEYPRDPIKSEESRP